MRDKFIALEPDKCEFLYLLARATGAVSIVEAGTSFGVSTIYLALAAGQNAAAKAGLSVIPGQGAKVIATEKEPTKAEKARDYWMQAGEEVQPWITLLVGDLLETLPGEVDKVDKIDLLLLDSKLSDPSLSQLHCLASEVHVNSCSSLDRACSPNFENCPTKAPTWSCRHRRQHSIPVRNL